MFIRNPAWLVPYFDWAEFHYVALSPNTRVADNNPSRFAIAFVNHGTVKMSVSTRAQQTNNMGWRLEPGQPPTVLDFTQWGPIVGSEWYAMPGLSGDDLTVFELIFKPER